MRLPLRAVRLLSRPAARRHRCRRQPARDARDRRSDRQRLDDDRSHAAEAGRDARGDREAVPGGGGVPLRDGVRESGMGRHRRGAPARQRRRRVLRRRVSAGRDHTRRQGLRDPPGHLRRRDRDRHGHQHRRAEVRRPSHGGVRHRGRGRAPAGRAARSARSSSKPRSSPTTRRSPPARCRRRPGRTS